MAAREERSHNGGDTSAALDYCNIRAATLGQL
jgi:hypothetical protein